MKTIFLAVVLAAAASAASATTTLIDFESYSEGDDLAGLDLGGVVLTTGIVQFEPLGSLGILPSGFDFTQQYRADFTVPGVTSVSVDLGDLGADEDFLYLEAYDSMGMLLGSDNDYLGAGILDMLTLSVSTGSAISYVEFYAVGFNGENNAYADNLSFTYDAMAPVPLPAGAVLLGSALAGFGLLRRKG
jgi:hypothetical protein